MTAMLEAMQLTEAFELVRELPGEPSQDICEKRHGALKVCVMVAVLRSVFALIVVGLRAPDNKARRLWRTRLL